MTTQPAADQPLITHEDLPSLMQMRGETPMDSTSPRARLLDRLIAAAEADKPALPEGWVLRTSPNGYGHDVLWHREGLLFRWDVHLGSDCFGKVDECQGRLTPLVTAASLVPEGWHVDEDGCGRPTVWAAGGLPVDRQESAISDPAFDVLAALVTAAQAERGESR